MSDRGLFDALLDWIRCKFRGHDFATISAGRDDDHRTVLGRWCLRCGKDDVATLRGDR